MYDFETFYISLLRGNKTLISDIHKIYEWSFMQEYGKFTKIKFYDYKIYNGKIYEDKIYNDKIYKDNAIKGFVANRWVQ